MSEGAQILLALLRYMNRGGKGMQPAVFLALIDCIGITDEERQEIYDTMQVEMAVLDTAREIVNNA